jgi:type I restriction enzyme R subunit
VLHTFRVQQTFKGTIELADDDGTVSGISVGSPHATEDEKDLLSNIVQTLNDTYGTDLNEEDKVDIESIHSRLRADEGLQSAVNANNTRENIKIKFDSVVDTLILEFVHNKLGLYKKLSDPKINAMFKNKWFEGYYRENVAGRDQPRV